MKNGIITCLLLLLATIRVHAVQSAWVHYDANHFLVYSNDDLGNHIPDFSYAGFGGGGVPLPTNAVVHTNLSAVVGDNTPQIQAAINAVAALPLVNGSRGVVLLNPGIYEMDGTLTLGSGGVILRGSGSSTAGTILHFLGASRQTVALQGSGSISRNGSIYTVTDSYVPLGATNFHVTNPASFAVGNLIIVQRPVTQVWINAIGMNLTNINWTPSSGLSFERTITAISSNQLTIDIPLFNPIEQQWCTGNVYNVTESAGRITNAAIESLRLRSDFSDASTNWGNSRALNFDSCKNCWFRDIVVDNYYNGINSGGGAKWCTVQDCYFVSNTIPTTSAGAAAFGGSGQMLLCQRCGTSNSTTYHVLVTQAAVPGPNVFLNFNSSDNGYDCGPHQRWAAGVLIDNNVAASISGGNTGIKLENRGTAGSGQGYGAGFSIIYNGNSKGIINEIPPVNHHYNWAIGGAPGATFIHRSDDGFFDATNGLVNPRSLYLEQLRERLGGAAVENIGYPLFTLSPSPVAQAVSPGSNAVYTVSLGDPTLMSNLVTLAGSGLPAGATASWSTNIVTGVGNALLTVSTPANLAPGNYPINIIGANAGLTHTSSVSLVVGSFSLSASPAAQTILPGGGAGFTVTVATNSNFTGSVRFGLGGLPSGAVVTFTPVSLAASGTSALSLTTTTNTPPGSYPLTVYGTNGSAAESATITLTITNLQAVPGTMLWTGAGADMNWSGAVNWTNFTAGGYGPPGAATDVKFFDAGAAGAMASINNIVNGNFAAASLQYGNTNGYHSTLINPGQTLTAGGLAVGTETDNGNTQGVYAVIGGIGATLSLTNSSANLIVRQASVNAGSALRATLDLSGLDQLTANIARLEIGSLGANARPCGTLYLARNNRITAAGSSPAILVGGQGGGSGNGGNGSFIYLGQTNTICANGISVATVKQGGCSLLFNPAWSNAFASFRSADGVGPVPAWFIGDSGSSGGTVNTTGTNDFSGGAIDALVANLTVARSSTGSGLGNPNGTLTLAAGVMNVGSLEISYQGLSGSNFPTATVNVNGTASLQVSTNLELAHAAGGTGAALTVGMLNFNGGLVQCASITGGGGVSIINLNSGTLDMAGGTLTNVSSLSLGNDGASGPALLESAATLAVSNIITIAANGTLAGNTLVTAPGLVINGTLSPGGTGIGAITNSGSVTLGAGGTLNIAVQNANGTPVSGWDYLSAGGVLNVQATNGNPFIIQVQSFDPNGSGTVTNFSYNTNYNWVIASASGGITHFSANQFTVDTTFFQNDLAGGYFYVRTNGHSLVLSFTNNHPPMAGNVTFYRTGSVMAIPVASLTNGWSDPDGDPVALAGVSGSTNGTAAGTDGTYIYYTNTSSRADEIIYTVQDVRTNPPAVYRGDDTVQTATGQIILLPPPVINIVSLASGKLVFGGAGGIGGGTFYVLATTNLLLPAGQWQTIATNNFGASGTFNVTNLSGPGAARTFYRLRLP